MGRHLGSSCCFFFFDKHFFFFFFFFDKYGSKAIISGKESTPCERLVRSCHLNNVGGALGIIHFFLPWSCIKTITKGKKNTKTTARIFTFIF
jgi:hypothetical protein